MRMSIYVTVCECVKEFSVSVSVCVFCARRRIFAFGGHTYHTIPFSDYRINTKILLKILYFHLLALTNPKVLIMSCQSFYFRNWSENNLSNSATRNKAHSHIQSLSYVEILGDNDLLVYRKRFTFLFDVLFECIGKVSCNRVGYQQL